MKKLTTALIALALILTVSGCGVTEHKPSSPGTTEGTITVQVTGPDLEESLETPWKEESTALDYLETLCEELDLEVEETGISGIQLRLRNRRAKRKRPRPPCQDGCTP